MIRHTQLYRHEPDEGTVAKFCSAECLAIEPGEKVLRRVRGAT